MDSVGSVRHLDCDGLMSVHWIDDCTTHLYPHQIQLISNLVRRVSHHTLNVSVTVRLCTMGIIHFCKTLLLLLQYESDSDSDDESESGASSWADTSDDSNDSLADNTMPYVFTEFVSNKTTYVVF